MAGSAPLAIQGVELASADAGLRRQAGDDLVLMSFAPETRCAAVFTRNVFCAAPIHVAKWHLGSGDPPRCLLINAGNANAGTGQAGIDDAIACCDAVAEHAGVPVRSVLPFSTGVIGERLPVDRITAAIPALVGRLDADGWAGAASAILTTDTRPKTVSRCVDIDGREIRVTGMAKGAGMIRPDMATMLAFVATDAGASQAALQQWLNHAVERSFNRITVDGDTSTNDAVLLAATGRAGGGDVPPGSEAGAALEAAIGEVCETLALMIVRDGEGATRLITVRVEQGRNAADCLEVAYAIAHSPLVKTAFFAADPNWGRILAAVGRARVSGLALERIGIWLDELCVVRAGEPDPAYTEERGAEVMARPEVTVRVTLGMGAASERVWTCDLSDEYVRINAEYRT